MPLTAQTALRKDRNAGFAPMEHRHFATIAAIIFDMPSEARHVSAISFANRRAATNPRFDRERFLAACGV